MICTRHFLEIPLSAEIALLRRPRQGGLHGSRDFCGGDDGRRTDEGESTGEEEGRKRKRKRYESGRTRRKRENEKKRLGGGGGGGGGAVDGLNPSS